MADFDEDDSFKHVIEQTYAKWRNSVIQRTWRAFAQVAESSFGAGFLAAGAAILGGSALFGAVASGGFIAGLAEGAGFLFSGPGMIAASTIGIASTAIATSAQKKADDREFEAAMERQKADYAQKKASQAPAHMPYADEPSKQKEAPAKDTPNDMGMNPAAGEAKPFSDKFTAAAKSPEITHLENILRRRDSAQQGRMERTV